MHANYTGQNEPYIRARSSYLQHEVCQLNEDWRVFVNDANCKHEPKDLTYSSFHQNVWLWYQWQIESCSPKLDISLLYSRQQHLKLFFKYGPKGSFRHTNFAANYAALNAPWRQCKGITLVWMHNLHSWKFFYLMWIMQLNTYIGSQCVNCICFLRTSEQALTLPIFDFFAMERHIFDYKWKKPRWIAWNLNLGP